MAETTSPRPLAGVRVIDFATVVMAPYAAHAAEVRTEPAAAAPKGRKSA